MKSPSWPGLNITLRSDGKDLTEYDVGSSEAEQHNPSGYVETVEGQVFTVEIEIDSPFQFLQNDILVYVYLDGRRVRGALSFPGEALSGSAKRTRIVDGARSRDGSGVETLQRFTFTKLKTVEDIAVSEAENKYKGLGEVAVKVYRVETSPSDGNIHSAEALCCGQVPHKVLKGRAVSNRASLMPAEIVRASSVHSCKYRWGHDPFAIFTFHCRSRKDLQDEGRIPRTPSPIPLDERDPSTLTAQERVEAMRVLQRKRMEELQKRDDEAKQIKNELKRLRDRIESTGGEIDLIEGESRSSTRKRLCTSAAHIPSTTTPIDLSED